MKRIVAAITTAAVAIGLAVVGVSGAAVAGSDSPVPYTVTTTGITLPGSDTFTANGHNDGNVQYIPSSQYVAGQTYRNKPSSWTTTTINFHLEGKTGYGLGIEGSHTLPFSSTDSDGAFRGTLPTTGYCIVWVQVGGYDEHFGEGGQAPICSATVSKNASAVVATIGATCSVGETLDLSGVDHASFGTVTYSTSSNLVDRTYSVIATAEDGYTFPSTGTNTLTLTGSLAGVSTTGCASTPACISSPTYQYSFDGTTNGHSAGGSIVVSKSNVTSGTLCQPLYVRSVTWNYDLPTNGSNPSWYQTFDAKQDLTISTLGTFRYDAPDVTGTCQQHDIYATFDSTGFTALAVPTQLKGPNNPYEPAFLASTLSGKGPNPTYSSDSSTGCTVIAPVATIASGACYWDASQHGSFKTAELTYDNSGSNVPVVFTVTGYADYTKTVAAHSTATVSLPASWVGGVGYTVVANGESFPLSIPAYTACPPTIQTCAAQSSPVLSTNLAPAGWSFAETRANGHNTYVAGGLAIATDGSSQTGPRTDGTSGTWNTDKAAGYVPVNIPLSQIGTPSIDYTATSGALPGLQLTIDKDGDGGSDGNLVYEPSLFGAGNWWSSQDLGVVSTLTVPNPSYQKSFGTLDDFLASWPDATITAVGYSLGSGAEGAGVIASISAGCQTFTFTHENVTAGVPAPVTFADVCGTTGDVVNVPVDTSEYAYTTTDTTDHDGIRTVTVDAVAKPGFAFASDVTTEWSHVFKTDDANNCVVIAGDPTAHNPVCSTFDDAGVIPGYITVIGTTGVTYTIHNIADGDSTANDVQVASGKTTLSQGSYTVTASAIEGYTLTSAVTEFGPLTIGAAPSNCDLTTLALIPPSVTAVSPVCTNGTTTSGYLQIDLNDGLNYFIGSTQLTAAKTAMAPGTYSVRAEPVDPQDSVDTNEVSNPMSVVIAAATVACGDLKTLAFTGGTGPSMFLIGAAILLMFGGALIFTRKRRAAPRHIA